ncbi:MAG: endonuclease domain-containing protein, partial [Gemmatimonadales bacterium]
WPPLPSGEGGRQAGFRALRNELLHAASLWFGTRGAARYARRMDPLRRLTTAQLYALARQLRRAATPAERYTWSLLRSRAILGLKFRRQHVLHGFVVDFYCVAQRIVLELEGDVHDEPARRAYDAARTAFLEAAGYCVIRVRNRDVTREYLESLLARALGTTPPPLVPPTPAGRGGQGVRTSGRGDANGRRLSVRPAMLRPLPVERRGSTP